MSFLISIVFIFLGACCFSMAVDDFIKKRYWFPGFYNGNDMDDHLFSQNNYECLKGELYEKDSYIIYSHL